MDGKEPTESPSNSRNTFRNLLETEQAFGAWLDPFCG